MADLFGDDTPESDFSLPGDEEVMGRLIENSEDPEVKAVEGEKSSPDVSEAARVLRAQRDAKAQAEDAEAAEGTWEDEGGAVTPDDDPIARRLAEKDAMIGRQSNEIGELRARQQQVEQYLASLSQQQQQQAPPSDWDELIDTNPAYATQLAYANGDQYHYQQARQAWEDMAPGSHDLWAQNYALQQQMQAVRQQTEYMQNHFRRQELGSSVGELAAKYPDLPNLIDDMANLAPEFPHEVMALSSHDPMIVSKAVESLYLKARGRATDTLGEKAADTARRLAGEEQRAIEEAAVVSASRTGREPAPSMAEQIAADWPDDDPLKSGWNI